MAARRKTAGKRKKVAARGSAPRVEDSTHFGRAGELFAMSELLLRGWNVAVPVVDVGDDVLVLDDGDKTTFRLQVKSRRCPGGAPAKVSFPVSRVQLRAAQPIELMFMFVMRLGATWRFLLIPRKELEDIRQQHEQAGGAGRGRPPIPDARARQDGMTLTIEVRETSATGWGAELSTFLDRWPTQLPDLSARRARPAT